MDKLIKLEDVIVQMGEIDSVDMDGEVVMMNIEKGRYYGFNSIGSRIWQLIKQPLAVKDIISILLEEFNVDDKTCEETVLEFINELHHEELILIV